jgi:hypothetical protein
VVVSIARINAKSSQGLVRVGVVLVAGESVISRKVEHGVFAIVASSKI